MVEKKTWCELWAECFVRQGRVKKDAVQLSALSLALSEKEAAEWLLKIYLYES